MGYIFLFEHQFENNDKVEAKMFIHSKHKTTKLQTNSDVFADNIIKPIEKKKNDLDKNIKGSWFSLNRIHHGLFWFVSRDVTMTSFL